MRLTPSLCIAVFILGLYVFPLNGTDTVGDKRVSALSCGFDNGFCDWANQESASSKFHLIISPDGTRSYLFAGNMSSTRLTVARLLSPCITILKNTQLSLKYQTVVSTFLTELVIVLRENEGYSIVNKSYSGGNSVCSLKAINNVRIGMEVILSPGQSVQLENIHLVNEAEAVVPSEGCTDIKPEPLVLDYPISPTISCSFDRNLCGWQLAPQDTMGQVVIAREVFDNNHIINNFLRVPMVGDGALVIQGVSIAESDDTPLPVGPLLSPPVIQLRSTQLFFYYRANAHVNHAFLQAEYADNTSTLLWTFKFRIQRPFPEQNNKWLPARLRFCLTGRFRLAFHVVFKFYPKRTFWLDELTIDNENNSFVTNPDVDAVSGCPMTATSPTSVSCDSEVSQASGTSFCSWRCSDSTPHTPDISCSIVHVNSGGDAGDYAPRLALTVNASGVDLADGRVAVVDSPPFLVEPESQLVFTFILKKPPLLLTVLALDTGTSSWAELKAYNFTFDVPEWCGINMHFPEKFYKRVLQVRLQIEFSPIKRNPPFPPAFFAIGSIWYTAEEGHRMAPQIDVPPATVSCNDSIYANITCDFRGRSCDWHITKYDGNGSWLIYSGLAVLDGMSSQLDRNTKELHTQSYHNPLKSRVKFSYILLGNGRAFFSLAAETNTNRFRLWMAPVESVSVSDGVKFLKWRTIELDICLKFPFKLIFQGAVIHGNTTIMLDDVTIQDECDALINNVDCPSLSLLFLFNSKIPAEAKLEPSWDGQHRCDFESGHLCGWHNNDRLQMQWSAEREYNASEGNYVAKLSWNSKALTLPTFSYLVSPRLYPADLRASRQGYQSFVLQFSVRLSDVNSVYMEVYLARAGTRLAEIVWNSVLRADELKTSWVCVDVNVPELDAANINQLVFAVTILDSRGFLLLDNINLLVSRGAASDVPSGHQDVLLLALLILSALTIGLALACFVMRHRNKVSQEARHLLAGLVPWELVQKFEKPFWSIRLETQCLGEGRFGQVQLGWLKNRLVAIKRMRQNSTIKSDRFLAEMAICIKLGYHRNIVELLGVTVRGDLAIILEYCDLGCLLPYLNCEATFPRYTAMLQNEQDGPSHDEETMQLTVFAHDVARGLVFLSHRHIVHGDIAARNILLDRNKRAKIADFGCSRFEGDVTAVYENALLPASWMAPELLCSSNYPCSCQSDVWSFGVLIWEIFTLGAKPYQHLVPSPSVTCETLFEHLKSGLRLQLPQFLPDKLNDTIKSCWHFAMEDRPPITEIKAVFTALLPIIANEIYISCENGDAQELPIESEI